MGARWDAIGLGLLVALPLAALLALVIGLFSLRVQTIFFAMITLAVASAFAVLASQLSWLTGGEDGRSFRVPELLRPGTTFVENLFGVPVNGRTLTYYVVFVCCAALFLLCCASSIRRSAACCRRSAKIRSAPRRSATAP